MKPCLLLLVQPPILLGLSADEVELAHDVKNSNKGNETNAHDEHHIGRDLEPWGVIGVELEHGPSCTAGSPAARRPPPPHARSSCGASSLGA